MYTTTVPAIDSTRVARCSYRNGNIAYVEPDWHYYAPCGLTGAGMMPGARINPEQHGDNSNVKLLAIERVIQKYIRANSTDGELQRALADLNDRSEDHRLISEEEWKALRNENEKLKEPPLQYGVFLGPSEHNGRDVIVGVGGSRLEVRIADSLVKEAEHLRAGARVVLNSTQNVIGFRTDHVSGETAEVVN